MTILRPVGMATLSNGTVKFLQQGYRNIKWGFGFCFHKFTL